MQSLHPLACWTRYGSDLNTLPPLPLPSLAFFITMLPSLPSPVIHSHQRRTWPCILPPLFPHLERLLLSKWRTALVRLVITLGCLSPPPSGHTDGRLPLAWHFSLSTRTQFTRSCSSSFIRSILLSTQFQVMWSKTPLTSIKSMPHSFLSIQSSSTWGISQVIILIVLCCIHDRICPT